MQGNGELLPFAHQVLALQSQPPHSTFWPKMMLQLDTPTLHTSAHFTQHHEAAHFHSLQHCSLLPGPLKAPFAQGSLAGNPTATEHEEQTRAGNTIPQIKPLSVWKNDWDLPEYLPSSAHKDLNLFAVSPSPWVCSLWQAGVVGRVGAAQYLCAPQSALRQHHKRDQGQSS